MNSWQTIVALLFVVGAAGYLLWRAWQALSHPQRSSCSSCSRSGTGSPIVPVEALLQRPSAEKREDDDR